MKGEKKNLNTVGMPKSGKPWKKLSKKHTVQNSFRKESWEKRREKDEKQKQLRQKLRELREEKASEKRKDRLRREEKEQRKKINEMKSLVVQEIKDQNKISKWSRKARSTIMKMPKEIFYSRYGSIK